MVSSGGSSTRMQRNRMGSSQPSDASIQLANGCLPLRTFRQIPIIDGTTHPVKHRPSPDTQLTPSTCKHKPWRLSSVQATVMRTGHAIPHHFCITGRFWAALGATFVATFFATFIATAACALASRNNRSNRNGSGGNIATVVIERGQ